MHVFLMHNAIPTYAHTWTRTCVHKHTQLLHPFMLPGLSLSLYSLGAPEPARPCCSLLSLCTSPDFFSSHPLPTSLPLMQHRSPRHSICSLSAVGKITYPSNVTVLIDSYIICYKVDCLRLYLWWWKLITITFFAASRLNLNYFMMIVFHYNRICFCDIETVSLHQQWVWK